MRNQNRCAGVKKDPELPENVDGSLFLDFLSLGQDIQACPAVPAGNSPDIFEIILRNPVDNYTLGGTYGAGIPGYVTGTGAPDFGL